MNRSTLLLLPLIVGVVACADGDGNAAMLLVPDDVALHWDRSFNEVDDDLVALVPVDLMVYEAVSGEPVRATALTVLADDEGAVVWPFDGVVPLDSEDCDGAPCIWDAWRDRYVELAAQPVDAEPLETDDDGLVRTYVLVDAFPDGAPGEAEFGPVAIDVAMGSVQATFQLVPQ